MARIQILELPEGAADDRPPFILVIDQVDDETAADIARWPDNIATRTGARHVLCFSETIEIPANEVTVSGDGEMLAMKLRIEPDLTGFDEAIADAMGSAQKQINLRLGGHTMDASIKGDAKALHYTGRPEWCCPRAFETLGREHGGECPCPTEVTDT